MDDTPELTVEQRDALRASAAGIAARTREYLTAEYVVGAEVTNDVTGTRVTVAVQPPAGNAVSAGFTPEFDGTAGEAITPEDEREVARGLAASAALQVKRATDKGFVPTAQ